MYTKSALVSQNLHLCVCVFLDESNDSKALVVCTFVLGKQVL